MKFSLLAFTVVISALSAWALAYYQHSDRAENFLSASEYAEAKRIAALIASADRAGIRGEMEKPAADVVVRDAKWIHGVSEAVAGTVISRPDFCLCCGWRTAYFYRGEKLVISVAAIHGHQLRFRWDGGGGDFAVEEASWKTVTAALTIPTEANQSPHPTLAKGQRG